MEEGHWETIGRIEYRNVNGRYVYDTETRAHVLHPSDEAHHVEINLTQNKTTVIDAKKLEVVQDYKWCADKGKRTFYAQTRTHGKKLKMHRVLTNNAWESVDHIDGNGLLNIESNLRDGTHINSRNKITAKGYYYDEKQDYFRAMYHEYDGKHVSKKHYVRDYETREATEDAARRYYRENSQRVIAQIERDGPCTVKYQRPKLTSNCGHSNIADQVDRKRFHIQIVRSDGMHRKFISYRGRSKEDALNEAIAWRDQIISDFPKTERKNKKQKI